MFNYFRKNVIYKIFGYSVYPLLILLLILAVFLFNLYLSAEGWENLFALAWLLQFVEITPVIFLAYIIFFIIAFFTRHKFTTQKFSKVADLGCIIILISLPLAICVKILLHYAL